MARLPGRPQSAQQLGIAEISSEALYVKRIEGDRWEYGTCHRAHTQTVYKKRGVKNTMREAEDAVGMGQPKARLVGSLQPTGPSLYYGPEALCSGKS